MGTVNRFDFLNLQPWLTSPHHTNVHVNSRTPILFKGFACFLYSNGDENDNCTGSTEDRILYFDPQPSGDSTQFSVNVYDCGDKPGVLFHFDPPTLYSLDSLFEINRGHLVKPVRYFPANTAPAITSAAVVAARPAKPATGFEGVNPVTVTFVEADFDTVVVRFYNPVAESQLTKLETWFNSPFSPMQPPSPSLLSSYSLSASACLDEWDAKFQAWSNCCASLDQFLQLVQQQPKQALASMSDELIRSFSALPNSQSALQQMKTVTASAHTHYVQAQSAWEQLVASGGPHSDLSAEAKEEFISQGQRLRAQYADIRKKQMLIDLYEHFLNV